MARASSPVMCTGTCTCMCMCMRMRMCMVCHQASLVEVNTNGYMIGNLHKDFFALHDEQRAIMKLMGASGYPR
jgi:hypothetical protein